MIAADTSAWIDFFKGVHSGSADHLEEALSHGTLVMPLPVLFEVLSGPGLTAEAREAILRLPRLELRPGYWERAALLRRGLVERGLKARGMDCLIAQECIDHGVVVIAADRDFRHFASRGLKLA